MDTFSLDRVQILHTAYEWFEINVTKFFLLNYGKLNVLCDLEKFALCSKNWHTFVVGCCSKNARNEHFQNI